MTVELLTKQQEDTARLGEDDVYQYLSEIRRIPRLTPEEELELAKGCAQGDENAIRQMVDANLRLVVSVAREYAGRGVPLLDLIQEGSIGLLTAAKKFDYTMEFRFSTYATKWIRQGITRCLAEYSLIRVPAHTAERIRKVVAARNMLRQQTGEEPTPAQLSEACQIPVEKVEKLLQLHPEVCSLDAPAGEDDGSLGLLLENVQSRQPYEELVRQELNCTINALLGMLEQRQQQVIRLHFGMEDGICYSLEEIGKRIGVSKERTRQIKQQAMDRMMKYGTNMGLEAFLDG